MTFLQWSQSSNEQYTSNRNADTSMPTSTFSEEIIEEEESAVPTPYGIRNPTSPVSAGTPILADDFSLTVKPSISIHTWKSHVVGITFILQNTGTHSRIFKFQRNAITMRDNLSNVYLPYQCGDEKLYSLQQIEVTTTEPVILDSHDCCYRATCIQMFESPTEAIDADTLIVDFAGFGPYNAISVEITP